MKRLLVLLGLLGLITGCTNISGKVIASGVQIELTRVQRQDDGSLQLTWRVNNPNVVSYLFSKTVMKVSFDGTAIGTVTENASLGVPAQNSTEFTSRLDPSGAAAVQAVERALAQGSANYHLECTVMLLLLDEKFEKISLSASGRVAVGK